MKHKHLKTIVIILLNVLLCAIVIWLFTRNSILRPYAGSSLKEASSAMFLLVSLYANYFLFYQKLYQKSHVIYWLSVVLTAVIVGFVDMAIAYPHIASCNARVIQMVGFFTFFSTHLSYTIGRNLALNFFPYLFRERLHFRQSLEKERVIVYERVRMLDVTDKNSDIQLISIDEIFYCQQQRNVTVIYTVQNKSYTRLGSMKHLEQLFGTKEFIRITNTIMVPFQYIKSCKENVVVMKKMPWQDAPTAFALEPKDSEKTAESILEGLMRYKTLAGGKGSSVKVPRPAVKRKPIVPSDEKITEVFAFVEKHPKCNSADIMAKTQFSMSTVERCLSELKKYGLIEHVGSRRHGGYYVASALVEVENTAAIPQDGTAPEEMGVR